MITYRSIWIGGNLESATPPGNYSTVWWTSPGDNTPKTVKSVESVSNKYYIEMTIDTYDLTPPNAGGETEATYYIHIGHESTGNSYVSVLSVPISIHFVPSRILNYEYHYQVSYDLASDSPGWVTAVQSSFSGGANTGFRSDNVIYTHPDESVIHIIDPVEEDPTLETYATEHASADWKNPGTQKALRYGLLYSIGNIIELTHDGEPSNTLELLVGRTYRDPYLPFYSFVLLGRIRSFPVPSYGIANEVNRVVVHELGHLRGILGHTDGNPALPDGHYGMFINDCEMHTPAEGNYTPHKFPPIFCQGHIQALLNSHWYQEDLP